MKNNIKDLNTIYAYTDENLMKKNNIKILINSLDNIINVNLSSSQMKLFRRYGINKINNNNKNINITDRDIILNDIENFRKYYNHFSFSLDLDTIKSIFKNNNISLDLLIRFVDSSDYLWLRALDQNMLQDGITSKTSMYNNILIDLKTKSIPKEIIYDYPISLLFKFLKVINKNNEYVSELDEVGSLDIFSNKLIELESKNYITREYYDIDEILNVDNFEDYYTYNGYCGNYLTYIAFKELLKFYLDGITIYKYQGKYYTYDQLQKVYNINSIEHSKFINDNLLEYTDNIDDAFGDIIKYHPEVIKLSCKCIEIQDPEGMTLSNYSDPLSKLKLIFKVKSIYGYNKIKLIKPIKPITMYLSDFL